MSEGSGSIFTVSSSEEITYKSKESSVKVERFFLTGGESADNELWDISLIRQFAFDSATIKKVIELYIASSVVGEQWGSFLANYLLGFKRLITIADGNVYGTSSLLFLLGKERLVFPFSHISLVLEDEMRVVGIGKSVKDTSSNILITRLSKDIVASLPKGLRISVKRAFANNLVIGANDAVKFGIATGIVRSPHDIKRIVLQKWGK